MKTSKKKIYLPLMGRIGNQLFQYAFAYSLQREYGDATILIDESQVIADKWVDSLRDYDLQGVKYIETMKPYVSKCWVNRIIYKIYQKVIYDNTDTLAQFAREKKWQPVMNSLGLIAVERGYLEYTLNKKRDVFLYGYFQSERYFIKYRNEIRGLFDKTNQLFEVGYPNIQSIIKRNTVCISIKIEHNFSSPEYDVCDMEYYRKAINYFLDRVENPLFFICSDNVEKARDLFLKEFDIETILQPKDYSVSLSLSAMSKCKYFIINNTSFGWWAQYLSDYDEKIVIAPSKWKNNDDPVNIYDNQKFTFL